MAVGFTKTVMQFSRTCLLSAVVFGAIFFGAIVSGPLAFGASQMHPNAEILKNYWPPQMTLTRYSGHPDFFSQRSLGWKLNEDGRLVAQPRLRIRKLIGFEPCESILVEQQRFPLNKVIQTTGAISPADLPKYFRMSMRFRPGQINFGQMSRRIPRHVAMQMYGDRIADYTLDLLQTDEEDMEMMHAITASMWSVGGQVLDPRRGNIELLKMPWQEEPNRAELSKRFNRQKYKWVWEWGRTAHDLPKEAEPLASTMAATNYQELLALGGKLEDAYVMMHSFSEVNTRAYLMRFPGTLFPDAASTDKNDALLLVPLAQILKAFPPSRHSQKLHDVIGASHGKLDELSAIDLTQKLYHIRFTQLDNPLHPSKPLVLHDLSAVGSMKRSRVTEMFGIDTSEKFDSLVKLLLSLQPNLPSWNTGQYADVSDPHISQYEMLHHKALEISNLDPEAAAKDPAYVEKALIGAFASQLVSIATLFSPPESFDRIIAEFQQHKVVFAMTSTYPEVQKQIERLGPQRTIRAAYEPSRSHTPEEEMAGTEWFYRGFISTPHHYFFDTFQVATLAHKHMRYFQEVVHQFYESVWARHLLLTNPDVM